MIYMALRPHHTYAHADGTLKETDDEVPTDATPEAGTGQGDRFLEDPSRIFADTQEKLMLKYL